MMRRALPLLALLAGLTLPLGAQQKISRRIAIDPDASIRIYNLAGNTRVVGWDRDSIAVTGATPPGASFYFGGSGRQAKMGLERDDKMKPAGLGELEIRVPARARVWVKSTEGWIEVTGLSGEADLGTVGGSIRVSGALRLLTVETLDGTVEVSGTSQLTRIKTGGGAVTMNRPTGDLTVSTVAGAVALLEAEPATARVETVSGSVRYEGRVGRLSSLEIQTHSGTVDLLIPRETPAEFDLHSVDGGVIVALSPKDPRKPVRGKPLVFGNAGGGAHVMVRTFKADIRLTGRE